jgi:ATP-dependent Clp protease protease subunit
MSVIKLPPRKAAGEYRMVNKAADRGEIWLYGSIGSDWFTAGITAKQFADDLRKLGAVSTIDLRINSDGGVVTEAQAMYSLLNDHKAKLITHIDGIAASAASFVALAGDEIHISEGGFVMIHEVRGGMRGTAGDMRRMADVIDQFNATFLTKYASRTKQPTEKIAKWMADETWFDGKEAVANGFADYLVPNKMKVAASISAESGFRNLPEALRPDRRRAHAAVEAIRALIGRSEIIVR